MLPLVAQVALVRVGALQKLAADPWWKRGLNYAARLAPDPTEIRTTGRAAVGVLPQATAGSEFKKGIGEQIAEMAKPTIDAAGKKVEETIKPYAQQFQQAQGLQTLLQGLTAAGTAWTGFNTNEMANQAQNPQAFQAGYQQPQQPYVYSSTRTE